MFSWWFRVGLACFWAKREFRLGVEKKHGVGGGGGGGGGGRSPPHLQKHWR